MDIKIKNEIREIPKFNFTLIKPSQKDEPINFYIPSTTEKIQSAAFSIYTDMELNFQNFFVHKDNPYFADIDGVLLSKDKKQLLAYPCGRKGSFTVPDGISVIGISSFRMSFCLTEIYIPSSVKEIKSEAFYHCSFLEKVHIDNGVEKIGDSAFYSSNKISDLKLGSSLKEIGKKAFYRCGSPKEIVLPSSLKAIREKAFYDLYDTHFVFGREIETIMDSAFVGKGLSLDVPRQVQELIKPEIFAMNQSRKFSVVINFTDMGFTAELKGNMRQNNYNELFNNSPYPNKSDITLEKSKAAGEKIIKSQLVDTVYGKIILSSKTFISYGMLYGAAPFNTEGVGNEFQSPVTHILCFNEDGIIVKKLSAVLNEPPLEPQQTDSLLRHFADGAPYAYTADENTIILDLSCFESHGRYNEREPLRQRKTEPFPSFIK